MGLTEEIKFEANRVEKGTRASAFQRSAELQGEKLRDKASVRDQKN